MIEQAPRPLEVSFAELAAEAVVQPGEVQSAYSLGIFEAVAEGQPSVSVIVVVAQNSKVLVAVPKTAWDKKASKRNLPSGFIDRAIPVNILGCTFEERDTVHEGLTVDVWLGFLKETFWKDILFVDDRSSDLDFTGKPTGASRFPFAAGLEAAAKDKYNFPGDVVGVDPSRVQALEVQFASIQSSLQELLAVQRDQQMSGAGFASPMEDAPPGLEKMAPSVRRTVTGATAKAMHRKKEPVNPAVDIHQYPGLEPSAVHAALQAGIPAAQLEAMSKLLRDGSGRLEDYPRAAGEHDVRGSSSDEMDGPEANEMPNTGDPMVDAVTALTKIMGQLTKTKKSKKDSLEEVLDLARGSASGSVEGSSAGSGKHAAARNALLKTFRENPRKIWESIEGNMAQDFLLQNMKPNVSGGALPFSARGWAEHRSRIQGYVRTVRWVWGIAGVLDSIRDGQIDSARARCCIMLAQAEQESLDAGSFLLAQEFAMEPPAPVSSFQAHIVPDPVEMATTRLIDQRWIEAFADRLKQVDAYIETKKKLSNRSKAPAPPPGAKGGKKGDKGKGKGDATASTE